MLGSVFSWLSALLFRRVRLQHRVTASVCTDGHAIIGWVEDPPLQGPRHLDVSLELWVPEHRTTVREVGAEASGQTLESTDFTPMNLQPAEPQHQTVTFFPPSGAQLAAQTGDRLKLKLMLTRGRPKSVRVHIEPE